MKITCCVFKKEGFTSGMGFILEDGQTILRTKTDLVWAGKEKRDAESKAFNEFLDVLEIAGIEVLNREVIKA